jgi:hypothetical protein
MRELILLLLLLLSSCLGVRAGPGAPPAPPPTLVPHPRLIREVLVVEQVDAFVLESYPMQIRLAVRGYWPTGCTADVQVEQRLEADTLTVTIWRELPAGAVCPAVIVPYDETIRVEGGFTRLPAVITVNGWTQRLN